MSKFIDIMADCFFTEYEENIAYDKAEKVITEHDKQIRDEVISEILALCDDYRASGHNLDIEKYLRVQMKGEQNE